MEVYMVVHKAIGRPGCCDILDSVWFDFYSALRRRKMLLRKKNSLFEYDKNLDKQMWRVYKFTKDCVGWEDVTED